MTLSISDRELELIYVALGNRADKDLWPDKMTASQAVQRLVQHRNSDLLTAVAQAEADAHQRSAEKIEELMQIAATLESRLTEMTRDRDLQRQARNDAVRMATTGQTELDQLRVVAESRQTELDQAKETLAQTQEEVILLAGRLERLERELEASRSDRLVIAADKVRDSLEDWREKVKTKLTWGV